MPVEIRAKGEIPQELRDPEYWRQRMLTDLFWLCKVVLHHGKDEEYRDLNWVHEELCDFIDFVKNPHPQKMVLMLRDGLKSSIGARALLIQWFLRKAYTRKKGSAFIYCGIVDLAEDHAEEIVKEILTNPLIQAFFDGYIPKKKSDFKSCSREKIRYKGIGIDIGSPEKSLTGHHYELGINDNVVNEVNSTSATQRAKVIRRWQEQESTLREAANELILETTWWPDDLSGYILDPEFQFDYSRLYRKPCLRFMAPTGYEVFSCPCRDENGAPVWPEKVDEEYLRRKRIKQGEYLYNAMYELQPVNEEDVVLKPSWIVHYKQDPFPFIRNLVVDCAGVKAKESSYTAISLCDWDLEGNANFPYASRRKCDQIEVKQWIFDLIKKSTEEGRPVFHVGIEKEKYGIYLSHLLTYYDFKGLILGNLLLIPIRNVPEDERISSLVSLYEMGRIRSKEGLKDYENEVKTYYRGKPKGTDILNTVFYHQKIKRIPQKVVEPDFVPVIANDFAEQIRRAREGQFGKIKEIAAMF